MNNFYFVFFVLLKCRKHSSAKILQGPRLTLNPRKTDDFQGPTQGGGLFVGDDGQTSQDSTGLTVDSSPFTKRFLEGVYDHPKFLVLTTTGWEVPPCGKLCFRNRMKFLATGIGANDMGWQKYIDGVTNVQDEPRISAGAFNVVDIPTGMVFDFIFSNEKVYALYEHLPYNPVTSTFTYAVPVYDRTSSDEFVDLEICFSGRKVVWKVNGSKVLTVPEVGLRLADPQFLVLNGGTKLQGQEIPEAPVPLVDLRLGFGTFALLDFLPFPGSYNHAGMDYQILGGNVVDIRPLMNVGADVYKRLNDTFGGSQLITDFVYDGPAENDGQGAILKIKKVSVVYYQCPRHCHRVKYHHGSCKILSH